jgi:hypothetical protein
VFTIDENSEPPIFEKRTNRLCSMENIDISKEMVKNKLLKLKNGKACGPDRICSIVFKNFAESLCVPLSILFERSLKEKTVPATWKDANIYHIFKKGNRTDVTNYRSVSLTSTMSKVLESCVKEAIMKHLNINRLISAHQHGFVASKSCT